MRRKWLTSSDVAERFEVHVTTVIRWAEQGKLKSWKTPGGQLRFAPDEVERFLPDAEPAA